jgi:hypothetical protein
MSDDPPADWRGVVDCLLARWKQNPDVEAVLLVGSYATDGAGAGSDIDFSVLLKPGAKWDEPGLQRIDGFLLEIFGGQRSFFESFFEKYHADNSRIAQTQFATSKVLFDRNGEAEAIRVTARQWLDKPRIRANDPKQTEWPRRIIWSNYLRLEEAAAQHRPDFVYAYHHYLHAVYSTYAAFLGMPVMDSYRTYRYFTDAMLRRRYLQEDFPDGAFASDFVAAMRQTQADEMLRSARALRDRALKAMGGFHVPGEAQSW